MTLRAVLVSSWLACVLLALLRPAFSQTLESFVASIPEDVGLDEDDGRTLSQKIQALQSFDASVFIDVKLVGFDGEGRMGVTISEAELMKYFDAATNPYSTAYVSNVKRGGQRHELPFRLRFLFRVSKAAKRLTQALAQAIQPYTQQAQSKGSSVTVPVEVVDKLIQQDFLESSLSYTIYVLNLPEIKVGVRYTVVQWAGARDRYAWIDLTAGPVTFGPQTSGDGIVTEYSLPRVEHLFLGRSSQKNTPEYTVKTHQLMAELAATVRRSSQLLITPSIDRFPMKYTKKLVINLVVVHDREGQSQEITAHWAEVERELRSLALAGQEIEIITYHLMFEECNLCVAAFTHSLKSHTSNILSDGLRTQVHQYLDSAEMHDWLEHFDNGFWGIKANTQRGDKENVRVVAAFLYDLGTDDILLFDRFHQAVAFDDIAVAVQTRAHAAVIDYSCNGESQQFDPRDASRPLLAALLQTAWGVSPTHKFWNPHMNDTETNYLWSVGPTPFGYFSRSVSLGFSQRDAAARNVLFSEINATMSEVAELLQHLSSFEKEVEDVVTSAEHEQFVRTWNAFMHKLKQSQHFISLNSFNESLAYVRSSQSDLSALHELVHTAVSRLRPAILCGTDQIQDAWSSVPHLLQFVALLFGVGICGYCTFTGDADRPWVKRKKF